MFCFGFLFCFFFCFLKRALTRATDPAAPPTGRWERNKAAVQLLECKTSRRTNTTACNSDPQISCTKLVTSQKEHYSRAARFALLPDFYHHAVELQCDSVLMQILPCICAPLLIRTFKLLFCFSFRFFCFVFFLWKNCTL